MKKRERNVPIINPKENWFDSCSINPTKEEMYKCMSSHIAEDNKRSLRFEKKKEIEVEKEKVLVERLDNAVTHLLSPVFNDLIKLRLAPTKITIETDEVEVIIKTK